MAHGVALISLLCVRLAASDFQLPDNYELEVRRLKALTEELFRLSVYMQRKILGREDVQEHIQRCWLWYFTLEVKTFSKEITHLCRVVLLFAYGSLYNPGTFGSLDGCWYWAAVATPDEGMIREHRLKPFLGDTFMNTARWPPLLQKRGGIFFDVGSHTHGDFVAKNLLGWRPQHIHFFEPIPAKYLQLRAFWRKRYTNTTLHNYGLGSTTQFLVPLHDAPVYVGLKGSSTVQSAFHQFRFAHNSIFLDGCKHSDITMQRSDIELVTIRSVADTWEQLKIDKLAVLNMNCEGCEYEVLPALVKADLLQHIEVIIVQWHTVLDQQEALQAVENGQCFDTGRCLADAVNPALERYCYVSEMLEHTHRKLFGIPFQGHQLWELRSSHRRRYSE